MNLIQSDLYAKVPAGKKYDLIISNPPYVNSSSMAKLPQEYLHEPQIALDGGAERTTLTDDVERDDPGHSGPPTPSAESVHGLEA